jgi:hypothetical protein
LEHELTKGFNGQRRELCLAVALEAPTKSEADAKRSDPWKLVIAGKKKRETSTANWWLTERLHMGVVWREHQLRD